MNIEEIMKPYFDKKNRIETIKEVNEKNQEQINFLNIRLNRLRENKAAEIEEYVSNALNSNQNFYVGYGAMLRKDLEQEYAAKEQDLQNEINKLQEEMQNNLNSLNNSGKYHNVDVREYADFKQDARKKLFSIKKDLEFRLQEVKLNYDIVMLNLSKFKLEYDENHNVINGDVYKSIYAQADSLIDVKRSVQKELEKVNEYIAETELTKEEISVLMMSMTPWEKEE